MIKVPKSKYFQYVKFAESNTCNTVYPLSIAEGYQSGDIYTDSLEHPTCALFWHYCGFAYLSGERNLRFYQDTLTLMRDEKKENPRRIVLSVDDKEQEDYFSAYEDFIKEERYIYDYPENPDIHKPIILPDGYVFRQIDEELYSRMNGGIVPTFSWDKKEDFLKYGRGYCVMYGETIASVSFTAAVSHSEADIGIETNENFRRKGLGVAVAKRTAQYVLAEGKAPVWQCYYKNLGSQHTAEGVGFRKIKTHPFFKVNTTNR